MRYPSIVQRSWPAMTQSTGSQRVQRLSISIPFAVLVLLLSHSDSFSQFDSFMGNGDDCQEGECLGTDMFPEKSFNPGVPTANSDAQATGDSGVQPGVDRAQMQLHQLERLIAKQQNQLEHLERLVEKLHHNVEKLDDEHLGRLRRGGGFEIFSSTANGVPPEEEAVIIDHDRICTKEGYGNSEEKSHFSSPISTRTENNGNEELKDATSTSESVDSPKPTFQTQTEFTSVGHGHSGGMTVARYKPAWSEYFQFLSAVKVDGEVTCLHVLPQEGEEGLSVYVAVGDETGRVYIFLSQGDLLVDFSTISQLPVTAMISFSPRRNETMLLTGHSDGTVLLHKIWETTHSGASHGDDGRTLSMEYVQSLVSPEASVAAAAGTQMSHEESGLKGKVGVVDNPVTILEVYRVGKMRYILVSNAEGQIKVFRENGTFYGIANSSSQPLAFLRSLNTQRLLFLTEDGAASLDLRSMTVQSGACEGLNGSRVVAYAFEAAGRSKAYGFSAEGHMIYVALSGDTVHFECHVRAKKKLEIGGPVAPHGIKGYLLVATPTQVLVYNTTPHTHNNIPVGISRPLFTAATDEISSSFFSTPIPSHGRSVMASNRDRLVVLGFGDGYVGVYKSNLPVQKPAHFNTKVLSSPVFIGILVMLGGWYFVWKKRDASLALDTGSEGALASSSVTTPGYMRTGLGDQRENLMGSRRFSSPSKAYTGNTSGYSSGSMKFRTPMADESFRASVEPKFRGSTAEPNFRSSTVERSPYSSGRESLFKASPSVVEEPHQ